MPIYDVESNLLRLMNLPLSRFSGVVRTSDGFYIGREQGDIGYNAFLGNPAPVHDGPGLENTLRVWASLSESEREAVVELAAHPEDGSPIPLEEFGIPVRMSV